MRTLPCIVLIAVMLSIPVGTLLAQEAATDATKDEMQFKEGSETSGESKLHGARPVPTAERMRISEEQFKYIRITAVVACLFLMAVVFNLVRARKLRIEYAWLWFATSGAMLLLAVWYDLLIEISRLIFLKGKADPVSPRETLYLFGLTFLLSICLHYSVKISQLTDQVKVLVQELSLHKTITESPRGPDASPPAPNTEPS